MRNKAIFLIEINRFRPYAHLFCTHQRMRGAAIVRTSDWTFFRIHEAIVRWNSHETIIGSVTDVVGASIAEITNRHRTAAVIIVGCHQFSRPIR